MAKRNYYSTRSGINKASQAISLEMFLRLFFSLYSKFNNKDYFQEAFGYECIDQGYVAGDLGEDIEAYIMLYIYKSDLWPIENKYNSYTEDDVFDMIEFLYDHVSMPIKSPLAYHSYGGCGWHYNKFDISKGRAEFRQEINALLEIYSVGYELSDNGEILTLGEPGMASLLNATVPYVNPSNVEERVAAAIHKFRYRPSLESRHDAIRDLADVLELLRPDIKNVLKRPDESDLFNIANNFAIRHHNSSQKTDYDKNIWYSWMFYFYLSTIHAAIRFIQQNDKQKE